MNHNHLVHADTIRIRVGGYCSIAQDCVFFLDGNHRTDHASSFPFYELGLNADVRNKNGYSKGVPVIGNDVWIGHGVIILSGVTLGDGCVVGAGAVVAKDVPPYAVAVGNPARVVKYRFDQETIDTLRKTEWWSLPPEDVVRELAPLQHDVRRFAEKAAALRQRLSQPPKKSWFSLFHVFQRIGSMSFMSSMSSLSLRSLRFVWTSRPVN